MITVRLLEKMMSIMSMPIEVQVEYAMKFLINIGLICLDLFSLGLLLMLVFIITDHLDHILEPWIDKWDKYDWVDSDIKF